MKGIEDIFEKSAQWWSDVKFLKGLATCKTLLESIRILWQLKIFLVSFVNYMKWNFQGRLH